MSRWLILLLLAGPAGAAEPVAQDTRAGCPSTTPVEAASEAVAVPPAVAPPAVNPSPSAAPPSEPRQRARARGPAWHSFLPGIFK